MRPTSRPGTDWHDEARALCAAGESYASIARILGVSSNRVQRICQVGFIERSRAAREKHRQKAKEVLKPSRSKTGLPCGGEARWRGRLPIPAHAHPLVRQMVEHLNEQKTTISEVADRAGYRRCTVSDWRYRCIPRVDNLENVLNVLGLELVIREIPIDR